MYTRVGQIVEAKDLRTFPARNLSTVEGRWMSPDPAGLSAVDLGNPQSLNRYAYVVGNPFGLVDPTGLDPTQIYTPPITVTGDGPGPISVLSSYSAPGSHCSDRCLDAAEAASYNGAPLIYDLSYRKLVLPAKAGTPAPNNGISQKINIDPYPKRLFDTHWCGPGGAGPTVNNLDVACQQHDACYDRNGLSPASNWGFDLTHDKIEALKSCNQTLCAATEKTNDPGSSRVRWYFQSVPYGYCAVGR